MANNALGFSCILSKFYIKPQLFIVLFVLRFCCILSKFYIKPQLRLAFFFQFVVVSYRNSTSNHNVFAASANFTLVVSYRNSTSNHNLATVNAYFNYVVSYRNSTSNHNSPAAISIERRLYLIEILHQTTTAHAVSTTRRSCILSKFYIKPQQRSAVCHDDVVVSYRNSTSNHNKSRGDQHCAQLYLIEILHQTTTSAASSSSVLCCILSKFYIKPQRCGQDREQADVVSYRNSTSNHNGESLVCTRALVVSYRNSTSNHNTFALRRAIRALYLIEILHQTTTFPLAILLLLRCILSKFYIKPQPIKTQFVHVKVVSYRNSTSNHNYRGKKRVVIALYLIEILHQTTTSNRFILTFLSCILSKFYIKPQHNRGNLFLQIGCILSKFYIKPQL